MYVPIFTINVWSYLVWPPVLTTLVDHAPTAFVLFCDDASRYDNTWYRILRGAIVNRTKYCW